MLLQSVDNAASADHRAARSIARKLLPFEKAFDQILEDGAELLHTIAKARRQSDTRLIADDRAFTAAGAAFGFLMEVFDQLGLCHRALEESRDARMLDPEQVGCTPGGKAALRSARAAGVSE